MGGLSDKHNPNLNPDLIQFNTNVDGQSFTYPLFGNTPYIEYAFGIYNIFRFLRFDLVQSATYLDHPNVENLFNVRGLGFRIRMKVEF